MVADIYKGKVMLKLKIPHKFISSLEHKRCSSCKQWKVLSCFSSHRNCWDGLQRECSDCRHARYQRTRTSVLKKCAEYVQNNLEKTKKYKSLWYQNHKEVMAIKAKQYLML